MANEQVKLGKPEKHGKGIRWVKMVQGKRWVSKAVLKDTRENRREAWASFKIWREEIRKSQKLDAEDLRKKNLKRSSLKFFLNNFVDLDDEEERQKLVEATKRYPLGEVKGCIRDFLDILISHAVHSGDEAGKKRWLDLLNQLDTLSEVDIYETLRFFLSAKSQIILKERKSLSEVLLDKDEDDMTTGHLIDEYVNRKRRLAESGSVSFGYFDQIKAGLKHFSNFFGLKTLMTKLSEKTIREYSDHLLDLVKKDTISQTSASQYQSVFRWWVEAITQDYPEKIKLPNNISSKQYIITKGRKEPVVFTKEEFHILKDNASPKLRLFLLLMLNCGMYQGDIASLDANEIDWENGRIIRPRSKILNRSKSNAKIEPVMVNWLLWRETWELFKEFSNRSGLCFLTNNGRSLVSRTPNGRSDSIHSSFDRLVDKVKSKNLLPQEWKKDIKSLRKTGASVLNESTDSSLFIYYNLYLGSSVAKNHYLGSKNPVPTFDLAVKYIGEKFNIK